MVILSSLYNANSGQLLTIAVAFSAALAQGQSQAQLAKLGAFFTIVGDTLALYALEKKYSRDVILKWLKVFYRRFFSQQFKRNCLPDGPKVGSVAMSPRGDWRMPSDASWAVWKAELETLE